MSPRRRALIAAAFAGAAFAVAVIGIRSRGEVRRMTIGDGEIVTYVAAHFDTAPEDVHPVVSSRGTSLRYGRVGLAGVVWLLSFGVPAAMPYVQPLVMVGSAAAIAAAMRALFPSAPLPAALLPFAAVGVTLALSGGFAEGFALALCIWAVVLALSERWWAVAALLAVAILTRENAGAVLVGILVWAALRRRWRAFPIVLTSLVPVAIWYAIVAARYGHVPIFDPYLRETTDTIGPPVVAIVRSIASGPLDASLTAALHLALAFVGFALWRRSILGAVAAAAALQPLFAGPFSWHFTGEAVRTGAFLQLFVLLAVVCARGAWTNEPAPRSTSPIVGSP